MQRPADYNTVMDPQLGDFVAAVTGAARRQRSLSPRRAHMGADVGDLNSATTASGSPLSSAWSRLRADWSSCFESQGIAVTPPGTTAAQRSGVMFHRQIVRSITDALDKHAMDRIPFGSGGDNGPLRMWIIGPDGSGRSTALGVAVGLLLLPEVRPPLRPTPDSPRGQHDSTPAGAIFEPASSTFALPLATAKLLPDAETDVAVWFCRYVQHCVQCLAAQCAALRPLVPAVATFWKSAVAKRATPPSLDPRTLSALPAGSTTTWPHLAAHLQRAYRHGAFADFFSAALHVPDALREAVGMDRTVFVVDDADVLHNNVLVDWRTGGPLDTNLLTALLRHLAKSDAGCIATTVVAPESLCPPGTVAKGASGAGAVVSMCGMVTDVEAVTETGLPRALVCGGRVFPLSIFGGCPGFLGTLRKHVARGRALRRGGDGRAEVLDPTLIAVLEELEMLQLDEVAASYRH
jgi:hypothetical protein